MQKNNISVWWLVAALLPLAACFMFQLATPAAMSRWLGPLGAERFSAEIARTVSYGLVGDELAPRARALTAASARIIPVRGRIERER